MSQTVYAKALMRAAAIVGGRQRLREQLHVPMTALDHWLAGREEPPLDVFLKAVDIISGPLDRASAAVQRARDLRRKVAATGITSERTVQRSRQILASLRDQPEAAVRLRRPVSAAEFLQASFERAEGREVLEAALEAAIEATHAQMGNVQLNTGEGLRIAVYRGFNAAFLEFFACVTDANCACGTAIKNGRRIIVSDVASDAIFVGTEAARVMQEAGARAVQSTPLISVTGQVLGMLSTHFDHPHRPADAELALVDRIAARAASWLEPTTA